MSRTSTYTYSPGSGAKFHIEVSGRPFGVVSDSEDQEDDATEAQGARGAWLALLRAAVDAAFDEVDAAGEIFSPAKTVLKKTVPEMSAGSPVTAMDWQSPSDVSTEAPWNQDSPSPAARSLAAELRAQDSPSPTAGSPNRESRNSGLLERHFKVCAAPPYQGVQYRRSKCMDDLHPSRFAENGTHVLGYLQDGAWLRLPPRCGDEDAKDLYLPVTVDGEQVLRPKITKEQSNRAFTEVGPLSWTCCARDTDESDGDPFLVREHATDVAAEPAD